MIYRRKLKNREFDKETPRDCCPERVTIAGRQGAREDDNPEVKSTQSKTDSSTFLGIYRRFAFFPLLLLALSGCYQTSDPESIVAIQIQDRNNLTETISAHERLEAYTNTDFLASQPYKKVLRIYRKEGKSHSKITTYHPNGIIWQYLEAEELRAHGAYLEWHPNGQKKVEATVIGGTADVSQGAQQDWLFDGISKVWNEKGHLIAKIPYENGSLENKSVYFFPNGNIEKELSYHNHMLDGSATEYYQTGTLRSKTSYKAGDKHGVSLGYFQNGQIAREESYMDDLLLNASYYDLNGTLLSQVEDGAGFRALFEGDSLSFLVQIQQGFAQGGVKQFSAKGDLLSTYHIKNGKKSGTETVYYSPSEATGTLTKLSIDWEEGNIHGSVKTWYKNGQMQSQRDFCRNKKMGPSLSWYRNGSLMLVEEYEEDTLVKGQYYKKNAIDTVSSVIRGTGVAHLYDEDGIFLRKISYVKGEVTDPND